MNSRKLRKSTPLRSRFPLSRPRSYLPELYEFEILDNLLMHVEMNGTTWSPKAFKTVSALTVSNLRITEINYHPKEGTDYQFLEIKNVGSEEVDLSGVSVADAVEYSFEKVSIHSIRILIGWPNTV